MSCRLVRLVGTTLQHGTNFDSMRCRVDKTHDQRNKTGFANIANFVGSVDIDWHSFLSYSSSSLWARSLIMDPSLDRTRRRRETTRSKLRYYKTNILQSETRFSKARIISYQSDTFFDRRVGLRWQGLPLGQPLAPSDSSGSTSRVASETHFRPSSPVRLVSSLSFMSRVSRAKQSLTFLSSLAAEHLSRH